MTKDVLGQFVAQHKRDGKTGLPSVCSAHPLVLEAALRFANVRQTPVLIEATSNQVDQTGGYTGMTPADFFAHVKQMADAVGLDRSMLVLGGDHLGPNRWQKESAAVALPKAEVLVRAYAAAGFRKIHLDCSMSCADDPVPLTDAIVARRAARLAQCAEEEAISTFGRSTIRYIVGTEVPVPGGAAEALDGRVVPTRPDAARATIEAHRDAFLALGLEDAWSRVMGLVAQPGVEFDHTEVVDFIPARAEALSKVLDTLPNMVFEAHSTDYQTRANLTALVQAHFAILKVGPGLTFALREALFALEEAERFLVPDAERSQLSQVVEEEMLANPGHWQRYYPGNAIEQRFARRFSFSDRVRYYWPNSAVQAAQAKLFANLEAYPVPLPLLSRMLPLQYARVRAGELGPTPRALAIDHVMDVLRDYASACARP